MPPKSCYLPGNFPIVPGNFAGNRLVLCVVLLCTMPAFTQTQTFQKFSINTTMDGLQICETGKFIPVISQVAPLDQRPFLHPLRTSNHESIWTAIKPSRSEAGICLLLQGLKIKAEPGAKVTWKRKQMPSVIKGDKDTLSWQVEYIAGDESGSVLLEEVQRWTIQPNEKWGYRLLLEWVLEPKQPLSLPAGTSNGLYLVVDKKTTGAVINAENKIHAQNLPSKWFDVGFEVKGIPGWLHVGIIDHHKNPVFPAIWKWDPDFATLACFGDKTLDLEPSKSVSFRYQIIPYADHFAPEMLQQHFDAFNAQKK